MAIGSAGTRLRQVIDAMDVVHHHSQPGNVEQSNPRELALLLVPVVQFVLGQQILEDAQGMTPHRTHFVEATLQLLEQQTRDEVLATELFRQRKVLYHLRGPVLRIQDKWQIQGNIVLVLAYLLQEVELVFVEYPGVSRRELSHVAAYQPEDESPVHVSQTLTHKVRQGAVEDVGLLRQILVARGDIGHQDPDQLLHPVGIVLGKAFVSQHSNPAGGQQVLGHALHNQVKEYGGVAHELVDYQEVGIAGIQEVGQVPAKLSMNGPLPGRLLTVVRGVEHELDVRGQEVGPLGLVTDQMDDVRQQSDDIQADLLRLGMDQQSEQLVQQSGQIIDQGLHVNGVGRLKDLAGFRLRRHCPGLATFQQSLAVGEEVVQVLVRRQNRGVQAQCHRVEIPLIVNPLDIRTAILLRNWKGL